MRLPTLKSRQVLRALKHIGFEENRQTGSHLILINKTTKRIITLPMHTKDLKRGFLADIIKQSGVSIEEFLGLV